MGKRRLNTHWAAELGCYVFSLVGINTFKKSKVMYINMWAAVIAKDVRFRLPALFVYLSFLIFFDFVCIFYFHLKIDLIRCGLDKGAVSSLGAQAQHCVCGAAGMRPVVHRAGTGAGLSMDVRDSRASDRFKVQSISTWERRLGFRQHLWIQRICHIFLHRGVYLSSTWPV